MQGQRTVTASANQVLIGGFSDEAAIDKTLDQQFAVFAALGLQWLTLRFVDCGNGIKNVMQLDDAEIHQVQKRLDEYGLRVSCIGSPIGKVKLRDVDDGTSNRYVPFQEYISNDVPRACELAQQFDAKLIRGFSFYHPKDSDVEASIDQAIDQIASITEACASNGLVFGLEVETNLIGNSGRILKRIHSAVNHSNLVLVFDGGNLVTQGYSTSEIFAEYQAMKDGLGWVHVKDFLPGDSIERGTYVDEEALDRYVPATMGHSGYRQILADLKDYLPSLSSRMQALGVPGVFVDLEPHVKGGGQFGGFSGPDGFGISLRELCELLDECEIAYQLRNIDFIAASEQRK